MTDKETLDFLKQSETVQLILDGKYQPHEVDSAFRNIKKRLRELEHLHQLELAQIVAYRRQIELLMIPEEGK